MTHYIGIKFRDQGSLYYFQSSPFVVKKGTRVIVKSTEGLGLGTVAMLLDAPPDNVDPESLKPIYRVASEEDLVVHQENEALAKEAFGLCRQSIRRLALEMKLVDVEVYFDRSKMVFYFTAPGRIDFRELVKDLVKVYRTRIELRQIGVRHEAQMLGGIGNCGQVCCCRRFLRHFEPVTIKMAKEQQLFLNPSKISGACGRLLCCLSYEEKNYAEFRRSCPKIGKKFQTRMGRVKVLRANLMRNALVLLLESGEEKELTLEEWHEIYPAPEEGLPVESAEPLHPPAVIPPHREEPSPTRVQAPKREDPLPAKAEPSQAPAQDKDERRGSRRKKRRGRPGGRRRSEAKSSKENDS